MAHAQSMGFENFTVVDLPASISGWMGGNCGNINYYGFGPCTQAVINWLNARTVYDDVYEAVLSAYHFGSDGITFFIYNDYATYAGITLVDDNGLSSDGKMTAFGDASRDLRASQARPSVTLTNNETPFIDRGSYPAGQFTLTANAESSSGTIEKVIFGKTTNGGGTWTTIEDTTAPYSAVFSASSGQTVISRAQAVDTNGKKSIYAAYMIYTN
ncbi:MAG: hypothetical protein ABIG61_06790 [Planctomycetota bacterium]